MVKAIELLRQFGPLEQEVLWIAISALRAQAEPE
jgi:hypothetical protein